MSETDYIDRKADISTYMLFGPIFFANIGINTSFAGIDYNMIIFGICFVIAGLLGKLIGCGLGAKITHFSFSDSLKIGLWMMVRAELALVCTQKGVENGLVSSAIMPFVLLIIILTSFIAPILIKLLYKYDDKKIELTINNPV